jgi:hypothetical protein
MEIEGVATPRDAGVTRKKALCQIVDHGSITLVRGALDTSNVTNPIPLSRIIARSQLCDQQVDAKYLARNNMLFV